MKKTLFTRLLLQLFLVLAVVSLTGCATHVTTRVTTFSQINQPLREQTWTFVSGPQQANSLEHQSYLGLLRQELLKLGWSEQTEPGVPARLGIAIEYSNQAQVVLQSTWVHDPFWATPQLISVRDQNNRVHQHWVHPVGMPPRLGHVPQTVFDNRLNLTMTNQQTGQRIYESSATLTTTNPELSAAMPWLIQGIMTDFPRSNGSSDWVRLPVNSNRAGP